MKDGLTLLDANTGRALGQVRLADDPLSRLRGLLGTREPPPECGLLLKNCRSIHTAFMAYDIALVFLDRHYRVLDIAPRVAPWSIQGRRRARHVLELSPAFLDADPFYIDQLLKLESRRAH